MVDWSLLPKDLLELINGRLETCFETVHLRSVCTTWRAAIPRPSYKHGLGVDYLLPIFSDNPRFKGDEHCILKKIPVFLFRSFAADCLIVGISERNSDKQMLVSPLPGFGFTSECGRKVLNTLSSQIIPLGHNYMINFYATTTIRCRTMRRNFSNRVAFLDGEDGGDFTVVAGVLDTLMMYRSREERWIKIECPFRSYQDMVSFKGKFYVVDKSGRGSVFVIERSLEEVSQIHSVMQSREFCWETLVVSGDDELLLVQRFTPGDDHDEYMHTWFRIFRLEEDGQRRWVRVSDLEERVVFLGKDWNLCCSADEVLGVKGNCVMFIQPDTTCDRILVFDLGTRKTTKASTVCRGTAY